MGPTPLSSERIVVVGPRAGRAKAGGWSSIYFKVEKKDVSCHGPSGGFFFSRFFLARSLRQLASSLEKAPSSRCARLSTCWASRSWPRPRSCRCSSRLQSSTISCEVSQALRRPSERKASFSAAPAAHASAFHGAASNYSTAVHPVRIVRRSHVAFACTRRPETVPRSICPP